MNAMIRLCASALLALGSSAVSASTIETLLSIPGLPGESSVRGYENWIDLDSVSVGVVDRACSRITAIKKLDRASPALSASALSGLLYSSMVIATVKVGAEQAEFLRYTLTNVIVTAVNINNAPDGYPMETIILQPGVITFSYRSQREDGTLDAPIQFTLTCSKYR